MVLERASSMTTGDSCGAMRRCAEDGHVGIADGLDLRPPALDDEPVES